MFSIKVTSKGVGLAAMAKNIRYGVARGLNKTAEQVQAAQREDISQNFTLRRPDWTLKSIKISKFAKRDDPHARIEISPPGAPSKSDILSKFQTDSVKTARGGGTVAVPVEARRNKRDLITAANRPRALLANPRKRAFILRSPAGEGVILQRVGKGKRSTVRRLYALARDVRLRKRLSFHETARRVVSANIRANIAAGIAEAFRSAR